MASRYQRLEIELHLFRMVRRHGIGMGDLRVAAVKQDALLYVGEGMSPREAVEAGEVHAFRLYGLPRGCAG